MSIWNRNVEKKWSPRKEWNRLTTRIDLWPVWLIILYRAFEVFRVSVALALATRALSRGARVIAEQIQSGGRVITIGSGGSGVAAMSVMREIIQNHRQLDASQFLYWITGGEQFLQHLGCEPLEDDRSLGASEIANLEVREGDVVLVFSASGRTPHALGAAEEARRRGAIVMSLTCQKHTEIEELVDHPIVLQVGAEMFTGATCEKAASAQKDALDAMMDAMVILLGVTKGNVCLARLVHSKARIREQEFLGEADAGLGAPQEA